MSGSRGPHLQRRNGVFHLRMRVPDAVRQQLGLREVRRSLQTYHNRRAQTLAAICVARLREAFDMILSKELSQAQARQIVVSCFDDLVAETEGHGGFVPETDRPDMEVSEQRELSLECVSELREQIASRSFGGLVQSRANDILAKSSLRLSSLTAARSGDILEGVARAIIGQQELFLLRLEDRLATFQPSDPLFRNRELPMSPSAFSNSPTVPVRGPTLGDAIKSYLAFGETQWIKKTHSARVWQLGYLEQFLTSGRALASVTSHDIRSFRDCILCLRKNHGRSPKHSFAEKQTDNVKARIAPKTASLIFEPTKALFRWAKSVEGMIETNPAEDVRLVTEKRAKGQKTRRPFRRDELEKLFSSPVFTGCKSRHRRYEAGPHVIEDAKFWVPILGYYTGCRLGELVQLHFRDLKLDGPIPHLSLNEDNSGVVGSDQKRLKSAAGERLVPLHPDVMNLGFAKFAARRLKPKRPSDRLFAEFPYGSDGQASTVISKWFSRFLNSIGLTDPALVFHSFRHGAEDAFRDALLPQYVIDRIIGHSDGATSAAYGNGVSLEVLNNAVIGMKQPVRLNEFWKAIAVAE